MSNATIEKRPPTTQRPDLHVDASARSWRTFRRDLLFRAQIRLLLVRAGVATAVIWTLGTLGAAWLHHVGAGWMVPVVFGIWVIVALPVLYLDLSLILDMVGYAFTGRVHVFPALLAFDHATTTAERNYWSDAIRPPGVPPRDLTPRDEESLRESLERSHALRMALAFIDASSPFGCFALWSMIVLARIPTKAYVLTRPSQARRMKLAADRTIYEDTLGRLAS